MENSLQSFSTESFSYSWLVNTKPSNFDSMDEYTLDDINEEEAAFIEMDPSLSPSKRFSNVNPHDFINFNFPISDQEHISSSTVSIMKNIEPSISLNISSVIAKKEKVHNNSSRRVVGIFKKLLDFLKNIRCGGCTSSAIVISSTRSIEGIMSKNWGSSEGTSITPRTSIANYSDDDWRRSCDSESSIYEAILHCKRTINGFQGGESSHEV
ncbi:hypothetical protein RND71_023068 [Anisodus tanguticus]|uniref:Membrane-associated kinase regulator 6 n=1 Tax=Anisodus tanguticus TaxID=243964 RepID=A0AAE1V5Q6_9SOLA|nr:hypothetical protein RND71_023068 [Anisodus tanguticus]